MTGPERRPPEDAVELVDSLGALWSPDFDAFASGALDAASVRCVLCEEAPCGCPEFGSDAYFALLNKRHGRGGGS